MLTATLDARTRRHLEEMAAYCRDFLTQSNPSSGRAGPVCPYSRRAVTRDLMLLTHYAPHATDENAIVDALLALRSAYLDQDAGLSEEDQLFHAVVITFPHVAEGNAAALIDRVHQRLKPGFTDRGLMFGEFYPTCPSQGLHNPDFRPLQTPVPALVIRHMTVRDAPFLMATARFRYNYVRRFGDDGLRAMRAILDGGGYTPPRRAPDQATKPS